MGEKDKIVRGAEREREEAGLREVQKEERKEKLCRGCYGMCCIHCAELERYCPRAAVSFARVVESSAERTGPWFYGE